MQGNKKNFIFIAVIFTLVALVQCRKSDRTEESKNTAPPTILSAENAIALVFKTVHSFSVNNPMVADSVGTSSGETNTCVDSIRFANSTITFPNAVAIDYGASSDLCSDGFYKQGKFKINYSNYYDIPGSKMTVTFSDFKADWLTYAGKIEITNKGKNEDSVTVYKMVIDNLSLVDDTTDISWDCNYSFAWTEGSETATVSDDQFSVTGKADGRTTKGNGFDIEVIEPLIVDLSCKWISQGKTDVDLGTTLAPRTIDYGTGSCDKSANIAFKATSYDLNIR